MFWINFEWLVFTRPYNFEPDGDTIKLNEVSNHFWTSMPARYHGWAIALDVMLEKGD